MAIFSDSPRPTLMPLCTLFAAVLSACGGGTGVVDVATAAAGGGTTAQSLQGGSSPVMATALAAEGASFSVNGVQVVRYGAGTRWMTKSVSVTGECTNNFFGGDPAVGTVKSCQLVSSGAAPAPSPASAPAPTLTPAPTPAPVAVPAPTPSPSPAPAPTLSPGPAPAPSVSPAAAPTPVPSPSPPAAGGATITAWVRLAAENEAFDLASAQALRFGDGVNWATKTAAGSGSCSVAFFGSDPKFGQSKFCEVQVTVPAVTQSGTMPVVNTALIPKPALAYSAARARTLSAGELSQGNYQPSPTTIGAFREPCSYSHMAFDDPIVFPGQPGKSHLHTFIGNAQTDAASTGDSLLASGDSTCFGGTLNRTAYWMPTLIDVRTGQPLVPSSSLFYYKLGYLGVRAGTVQPFPKGLRMIAGNSASTTPITSPNVGVECTSGGGHQAAIPSCAVGDTLNVSIIFPQCWDGVNLDSPDHKSHMAYATGNGCPSSHPVPLPEIALNVHYMVSEPKSGTFWKFSSDNYAGPGGYSLHADWFNGWDPATNRTFVTSCINGNMDCHAALLGDGRTLY